MTTADSAAREPRNWPRVGLVLVSHSARLAEGVAELAGQLGGEQVPIAPAGGTDDGELGTSITKIGDAVRATDKGAGVLLLADLGSAVLTIKALMEDDTELDGTRLALADAPLVEGAVSAVVTAAAGGDLAAVLASAEEARGYRKL